MPSPLTSPAAETEQPLGHRQRPIEAEAVAAVERGEIEARREAGVGAEHDIAGAVIGAAGGISIRCPDDQIVDAVAVDVASSGDGVAAVSHRPSSPIEAEAVAAVKRGEIEARREAGVGAEDDIAGAGRRSRSP